LEPLLPLVSKQKDIKVETQNERFDNYYTTTSILVVVVTAYFIR